MIYYTNAYWDDVKNVISYIPNIDKLNHCSVLITGATGMIGSSIAELLFYLNEYYNADIKIFLAGREKERMVDRFYKWKIDTDYFFVSFEASEGTVVDVRVDFIIYGASPADPASYNREPVETMLSNILGLKVMLDLAKKHNAKNILYISSSEIYGKKYTQESYKESDYGYVDLLNSRSCYSSAKRAAETLCAAYRKEYGVACVIVRPGHIYGPTITTTDSRASAQFTRKALAGDNIVMKSDGSQLRSYCYTLDCASAILTVLLNGKNGEAYNISNPDSIVSIREFAEEMANIASTKIIFEIPSNEEKNSYNPMNNSSLNSQKLIALGWKSCFNLKDGIIATLRNIR